MKEIEVNEKIKHSLILGISETEANHQRFYIHRSAWSNDSYGIIPVIQVGVKESRAAKRVKYSLCKAFYGISFVEEDEESEAGSEAIGAFIPSGHG